MIEDFEDEKIEDEDSDFMVTLEVNCSVIFDTEDSDSIIQQYTAKILIDGEEDVGFIQGWYIDIDLWRNGFQCGPLFEVFDSPCQEVSDCYEFFMKEDKGIIPGLVSSEFNNVFYLERLVIEDKKLRGKGIGSKTLAYFLRVAARNTGVVICLPVPLSKNKRGEYSKVKDKTFNEKKAKVIEFYKKIGFVELPNSPYIYFDTAKSLILPDGRKI